MFIFSMTPHKKLLLLGALTILSVVVTFLFPPIAQPLAFHQFADSRTVWGIVNFANVTSNLPFLCVGSVGLLWIGKSAAAISIKVTYVVLFLGVILTGLGSAWYHSNPNNETLIWDRMPMTIVFMSLLAATMGELVSRPMGIRLLFPLVLTGIFSVLWWHYTEGQGRGDLRLYFLVQFYPMLFIPLLLWLYHVPTNKTVLQCLAWVVVWYVVAKVFEQLDQPIYKAVGISGHTLKHLSAAVSTWYLVLLFKKKYLFGDRVHDQTGLAILSPDSKTSTKTP